MAGIENNEVEDSLFSLARKVFSLISAKQHDEARSLIDIEQKNFPDSEAHRFLSFRALLHESLGEVDRGLALMRQAVREKPDWLPHLYRLSVMLMTAEHWADAEIVLREIIALSLARDDVYFLDDSRFRRAVCLKMLGRVDEFKQARAEIPAGLSILIGDGRYQIDDIV